MARRRRRNFLDSDSPLMSAIESLLCKLAEKLAEWLSYRIILLLDPGYYNALTPEVTPDVTPDVLEAIE